MEPAVGVSVPLAFSRCLGHVESQCAQILPRCIKCEIAAYIGPMLRRAATFSHRTERPLKDVNRLVGLMNKSQERPSLPQTRINGQKVTRPAMQYSAVTPRYAAPLASKRQLSTVRDEPHGGHSNVTKPPIVTGRSAPQLKRRPPSDNLSSTQPPMVFTAPAKDAKPDAFATKTDLQQNAVGAKRPRVVKRTSMIEGRPQIHTRPPRLYSSDKGRCPCSKNGIVKGSVDVFNTGGGSLLYSAAHWVSLIKLAKGENKHDVVIDLFRLSIRLKAEPREDIAGQLKRYQESYPGDEVVSQLVEQCEGTQYEVCSTNGEVIDKSVCEPESKSAASKPRGPVLDVASVSKSVIVPPVAVGNKKAIKKDGPQKPPHLMGRMLPRSSTFPWLDAESQSQHAKAENAKKLAKTVEIFAAQVTANSPSKKGEVAEIIPAEIQNVPLACAPETETICKLSTTSEVQATPSFNFASQTMELESRITSKHTAQPALENFSNPDFELGCTLISEHDDVTTEKPVDSLSKWLDGELSEMDSPGVQSSRREEAVDFSLHRKSGVGAYSSLSLPQNALLAPVLVVETFTKSSNTVEVNGQLSNPVPAFQTPSLIPEYQTTPCFKVAFKKVNLASKVGSKADSPLPSSPVSEDGATRASAVCNGNVRKSMNPLFVSLDGDSSEAGSPEIETALIEESLDLSPDRRRAISLMDVDSLMREVVSHIIPDQVANLNSTSKDTELNDRSSADELRMGGNNSQEAREQSTTEIVENTPRCHKHSVRAEAVLVSVPDNVEEKFNLFTESGVMNDAVSGLAEPSDPSSASKECQETEVLKMTEDAALESTSAADISAETDSAIGTPSIKDFAIGLFLEKVSAVKNSVEAECATAVPPDTDPSIAQNEGSEISLANSLRKMTKQRSPYNFAAPIAATPSEPVSSRNRARHSRGSNVGNKTPRSPVDMAGEYSPVGDNSSSPSGQSSSRKIKSLREIKEVVPKMVPPKPSWQAMVEREVNSSEPKKIVAAKLPEDTSLLAEFLPSHTKNQSTTLESAKTGAHEKDATSSCSPSKCMTRVTKSSSTKEPVQIVLLEGAAEPSIAQKLIVLTEGEQEMPTGCPTPGSAVRRSARIHKKVQSRRNVLFKDEFIYL